MANHIHWHEGLFLQPHHLQRLQRSVFEEAARNRLLLRPYIHGVVEMQLSPDELANFRLRFERLRAVMPSGTVVDYPDNADLPALDLKPLFSSGQSAFQLHLGLPLWQPRRANAFAIGEPADPRVKLLYKPYESAMPDENTGDNEKPVLLRRLNARILTDGDDRSDMEFLPILRLARGTGDQLGAPKVEPEYVPPCVVVAGSPKLHQMLRDITAQVRASREELAVQITRGGFNMETLRGQQFEQILRLRTLNRFAARLDAILAAPAIAPFAWYVELRDLHAELASLHPEKDDFELPAYDHDQLFPVFEQLDAHVRGLLRGSVAASYMQLEFTREPGMQSAVFTDEHFTKPVEYFLAIQSKLDPREVVRAVEDADQFKFMPRSLATRAIRGVVLKEERVPPLQLPARTGLTFFRVNRAESGRVWQQIQIEKSGVLRWPEADASDFQITLFMTLP